MLRQRNNKIRFVLGKGFRRRDGFDLRYTLAERGLTKALQLRRQPVGAGFAIGNPVHGIHCLAISSIGQNAVSALGEQLFNQFLSQRAGFGAYALCSQNTRAIGLSN